MLSNSCQHLVISHYSPWLISISSMLYLLKARMTSVVLERFICFYICLKIKHKARHTYLTCIQPDCVLLYSQNRSLCIRMYVSLVRGRYKMSSHLHIHGEDTITKVDSVYLFFWIPEALSVIQLTRRSVSTMHFFSLFNVNKGHLKCEINRTILGAKASSYSLL